MSILYINLERNEIKSMKDRKEKGFFLAHALMEESRERIVFTSIPQSSIYIRGASSVCYAFFSSLAGRIIYGYFNSSFASVLYSFGYTALIIDKRAPSLSYISLRGNAIEIRECEALRGSSSSDFSASIRERGDDITIATGRAADSMILSSALYADGIEVGRGGFGHAFSSLNLKGLCVQAYVQERKESEEGKRYLKALERSRFAKLMKRDSSTRWIKDIERKGMLPIENFSRRHDARAIFLDGSYLKEKYGVYSLSCTDCPVSCKRVMQDGTLSPDLIEAMSLGSLGNIFSSDKVILLKSAAYEAGVEVVEAADAACRHSDLEDKLLSIRNFSNKDTFSAYSVGGLSLFLDPRGCGEYCIFLIIGDIEAPYFSIFAPVRINNLRSSAILALFERIYRYALISEGYPFDGAYAAYVSSIPSFVYNIPSLLRFYLEHMKFFSLDTASLIREGLSAIDMIGESSNTIAEHFIYTSSSTSELSTANPTRLMEYYKEEKARLEGKYLQHSGRRKGK